MERIKATIDPTKLQPIEVQSEPEMSYFAQVKKADIDYIPSGCTLLDCVLGGGWPLGRISNIVGDFSTGKCVKNGYILTKYGMQDISKWSLNQNGSFTLNLELGVSHGNSVIASHFYEEQATNLIKITTHAGFTIEATPNHPILVWTKDCKTVMKRMGSIEENDVAVIATSPQFFTEEYFDLTQFYHAVREDTPQNKKITLPTTLTEDLAQIFGYIVADGVLVKNAAGIQISNTSKRQWMTNHINHTLKQYGLNLSKNHWICSKRFYDLVFTAFGSPTHFTARYKYVPDCILQSPASVQAAFLRGLIDCDGWFNNKTYLDFYTASEQLANQVQLMLLNFGIFSTKSSRDHSAIGEVYYDHTYWTLRIPYKSCIRYAQWIGSDKYNFEQLSASKSYCEQIPYLLTKMKQDVDSFKTQLGWSKNGKIVKGLRFPRFHPFCNYRRKSSATYSILSQFIDTFSEYDHLFDLQWYKDLECSGFYFDPIVKIEHKIYPQSIPVYDVHVPEHHTFWCNGFVSHNTLLAIEACCNFHHLYKNGRIIYLEAEAAFDVEYARALGLPVDDMEFLTEDELPDFTIESWYTYTQALIEELLKTNQECLFIVDSLDALSDREERKRGIDEGSYNMSKPKLIGQLFRRLVKDIEKVKLHLMIISQIRDKIGVTFGAKHTRSGGKALDFYATQILWLSQLKKLERTIKKQTRIYGLNVKAKCTKNKVGLPFRECEFPIIFGYGIDDAIAMITWLEVVADKDAVVDVIGESYRNAAEASHKINKLSSKDKIEVLSQLSNLVIDEWESIEENFLITHHKY